MILYSREGLSADTAKGSDCAAHKKYRTEWHEYPKTCHVAPFPLFLDIEATSACNLRCPACVQTYMKWKPQYIDFSMYKRIIDEAAEKGCYGCKYHTIGRGEPLLHTKLPAMVYYAKKKGLLDVYVNTNGVLVDEIKLLELTSAGIDMICFSIDGYEKQYYEERRVGADFDKVLANVKKARSIIDSFHSPVKLRVQTIAYPDIDLAAYADFWKSYADEVTAIKYKEMRIRIDNIQSNWSCPQLYQRMSVLADGTILPCNHDDRQLASLGKFPCTTLEEAWHSVYIAKMRSYHSQGKAHEVPACDGCYLRGSLI